MTEIEPLHISFKKLPFLTYERQVIYYENEYNEDINRFIQQNYEQICETYEHLGYEFCYLPYLSKELSSNEYVNYFSPYNNKPVDREISSSFLSQYMVEGAKGSFLICYADKINHRRGREFFYALDLTVFSDELQLAFTAFAEYLKKAQEKEDDIVRYCTTGYIYDCDENYADNNFSQEFYNLLDDVKDKIEKLRQYGVKDYVLKRLLDFENTKLSSMLITRKGEIFLPEYNNIEIKMTPLVKAVYFLFLRHPEGIIFKNLPDYRDELFQIYNRLTNRISDEAIERSIYDVTNPCRNSINEKCSRIRNAFIREFDDRIAENYYITGVCALAKRITLPRHLIIWEW